MNKIIIGFLCMIINFNLAYASSTNTGENFQQLSFPDKTNFVANKILSNKSEDLKIDNFSYEENKEEMKIIVDAKKIEFPSGRGSGGQYNKLNSTILSIIKSFGYGRINQIKINDFVLNKEDIINMGGLINSQFIDHEEITAPSFKNNAQKESFLKMNYFTTLTAKYPGKENTVILSILLNKNSNNIVETKKLINNKNYSHNFKKVLELIDYTARNRENYKEEKNTSYYMYDQKTSSISIYQKELSKKEISDIITNIVSDFGTLRIESISANGIELPESVIKDILYVQNQNASWSWKDFLNTDTKERVEFILKSYAEYVNVLDPYENLDIVIRLK